MNQIDTEDTVLDIACGTGRLCFELSSKCTLVKGIDNDPVLIYENQKRNRKRGLKNLDFDNMDAQAMTGLNGHQFSASVLSLALHQFPIELSKPIIEEALNNSKRLIIVDYSIPLPENLFGYFAKTIEKKAGGAHYSNFKNYRNKGGLDYFIQPDLKIETKKTFGKGVFTLLEVIKQNH